MHEISKSFEFDFGHRVWTQDVDPVLGCGRPNMCRHLHGHRGKINVVLRGGVTASGMVTDFSHLAWFKKLIDDDLDHKMLLDIHDPLLHSHFDVNLSKDYKFTGQYYCHKKNSEISLDEIDKGIVLLPFVPTAENLSKMLFSIVEEGLSDFSNFRVLSVQFFETPSSTSTYTKDVQTVPLVKSKE